jgi:FAD synthetase
MLLRKHFAMYIKSFMIGAFLVACQHAPYKENGPLSKIATYRKGQSAGMQGPIVLVGGCFDVLHHGHIQFLEKAKAQSGFLVVALESDEMIVRHKKRSPLHTQEQRAFNIASLQCVDGVLLLPIMNGFDDYNGLVQDVRPSVIAITGNDPQRINKLRQAEGIGARLVSVVDRMNAFSSSQIIRAVSD